MMDEIEIDEALCLRVEYHPLSEMVLLLWADNPKLHDDDQLRESIGRYGYQSPSKLSGEINGGSHGVMFGNGRLTQLYELMKAGGSPPLNVVVREDGEWLVPMLEGNDLPTRIEQLSFAIDHNSLILNGADVSLADVIKMWDAAQLGDLLDQMREIDALIEPLTLEREEFLKAMEAEDGDGFAGNWGNEPSLNVGKLPDSSFGWQGHIAFPVARERYLRWLDDIRINHGFSHKDICDEIKHRLGIIPLENNHER